MPRRRLIPVLASLLIVALASASQAAPPADPLPEIARRAQAALAGMDQALADAARRLAQEGLSGPQAGKALAALCAGLPLAIDCAAIDPQGVMVVVEPAAYKRFEGSNIAGQPQVAQVIATRRPVLSAYFHTVEGVGAVDLERPVIAADGAYLGSASVIFDPARLMEAALKDLPLPPGAKVFLVQGDGRMLFNSEPAEIGRSLATDPLYAQNPGVKELAERIMAQAGGEFGPYEFRGHGDLPARRVTRWTSVGLHGVAWRVGVSQPAQ
ncbi:MAG: hypothetical protein ACOZHQ_18735 [Thermodesulfobacteriota bacterium]